MKLNILFETKYKSAVAIVFNNGKILLGKSLSSDDRFGKWCFPGGGIKHDESLEHAAARECEEETGYLVHPIKQLFTSLKPGVAFVICQALGGQSRPNHEFSELRWFGHHKALKLPDLYSVNYHLLRQI